MLFLDSRGGVGGEVFLQGVDPRPLEVAEMGNGLDWSRVVGRKRRCKDGCEEAKG